MAMEAALVASVEQDARRGGVLVAMRELLKVVNLYEAPAPTPRPRACSATPQIRPHQYAVAAAGVLLLLLAKMMTELGTRLDTSRLLLQRRGPERESLDPDVDLVTESLTSPGRGVNPERESLDPDVDPSTETLPPPGRGVDPERESLNPGFDASLGPAIIMPLFSTQSYNYVADDELKALVKLNQQSLCATQREDRQRFLAVPADQVDVFKDVAPGVPRLLLRPFATSGIDCWVTYKNVALRDLLGDLMGAQVVFMESDQLFFNDIFSEVSGLSYDFAFTFTSTTSRRACLNSGVIFIKQVTPGLITMYDKFVQRTKKRLAKDCLGGMDQNAICDVVGGYLASGKTRKVDGLKIRGLNTPLYMALGYVCTLNDDGLKRHRPPLSNMTIMSHFHGRRKQKMLKKSCADTYYREHKRAATSECTYESSPNATA